MTLSREQTMALLEVYKQHMGKPFVLSGMDLAASHLAALDEVERLKRLVWKAYADGYARAGGEWPKEEISPGVWVDVDPESFARAALEDRT